MDVIGKWEFKRLIDELSQGQYEQMVRALRSSEVDLPGWTDRLAPTPEIVDTAPIRFLVSLRGLSKGLMLALTAARSNVLGDCKRGAWLEASDGGVRVIGTDDYGAAVTELDATVDVPGTVVVEAREAWQIIEALRKSLARSARDAAMVLVETEGGKYVRLALGDRSHRAQVLQRRTEEPLLPPMSASTLRFNGPMLQRAIDHTTPAAGSGPGRAEDSADSNRVGMRVADGWLTLDAYNRFSAAQACLPAEQGPDLQLLVDYLWLRKVASAIGEESVSLGWSNVDNGEVFMLSGDRWAAWTSEVSAWWEGYVPTVDEDLVEVTFSRDAVHRYLVEARRLVESGWGGQNTGLLKITITDDGLRLSSLRDGESAGTGTLRVAAHSNTSEPFVVHVGVRNFLRGLEGFAKNEVTLHAGSRKIVYLTTPGYRPEDHPPALWVLPMAEPRPTDALHP
jgi:hypothetical protein